MIDLRSDLMTGASPRVRRAITEAMTRLPAMERDEDPDERRLNAELAAELGKEAALLFPTCTMANQAALRVWLPQGGSVAAAATAHVCTVEASATALTGVTTRQLTAERGHPSPEAVSDYLASREDGSGPTLIWLENTFMLSAGSVMPKGWQGGVAQACLRHSARLHLDGSRLWNAAAATGASMAEAAEGADSVSVSLNKAVGAPLGAILAGSRDMIEAAASVRAALGGEWRPLGWVAAGALAAMQDWRERLIEDHAVARTVAGGLQASLGADRAPTPETNLVFVSLPSRNARAVAEAAKAEGVLVLPLAARRIRLALHSGVTARDAGRIADVLARAVQNTSFEESS